MNLWDLEINDFGTVEKISAENSQNFEILNDLGIVQNSKVRCLYKTLLSGPRVFEINGLVCTLCKQSAQQISIKAKL